MPRSKSSSAGTRRRRGEPSDHDQGYKLLFSYPDMVEQLLRGFVREDWARQLDFSTLKKAGSSFVSDDLRERHDDAIWKLRWIGEEERWFWVYLLLEFQSTPDPYMPVRLLAYVGLLLQELIRQGEVKPGDELPAVLPIVLYRGETPWRVPRDLTSLFVSVPPGLERYLPQVRYLLVDQSRLDLDQPELQENLTAVLFRLEATDLDGMMPLAKCVSELVQDPALRRAFGIWIARIFRKFSPGVTIPEAIDLEDLAMLEERIRKWQEQQRQEGRLEGREEGLQKGLQKGLQEGLQKGRQKGLQEGQVAGMQKMILEQMRLRFGPLPQSVRRQVKEISSEAELRRLGKRLLMASSLDELDLTPSSPA